MQNKEALELKQQIAHYQYTADALCELRTSIAPVLAQDIVSHEDYRSWGMVGLLGMLYATDKLDGMLANRRASLMNTADDASKSLIESDGRLMDAINQGGRKDDKADKALTHAVLLSIATREVLNENIGYGALIAGADAVMYARDVVVGKMRDRAALIGKKGDARKLGKYKQGLLVLTAMTAVAPYTETSTKKSVGRTVVKAGLLGGVALSLVSGIDQARNLKK
jgi:phosphatidylglycerophosphate synthase